MAAGLLVDVAARPQRWLVTGSAGFIGSHLLEALLRAGQEVASLDNFATGKRENLDQVREAVGEAAWSRHRFIEGDVIDQQACMKACEGVDVVLHQAALGSVPRSIADPMRTHQANATGFLQMLIAARDRGVRRFIYAASSSTYGESARLPKVEDTIGRPLSPYAVTKYMNELYADVFGRCHGLPSIGLRYFNVFGPRQDPNGDYAAVIPRWIGAMIRGVPCVINGDGETSRDFCYVANAVQANLRAALVDDAAALNQVYNVALGERTSLAQLYADIASRLQALRPQRSPTQPRFAAFRPGDVRHSLADIEKARRLLGYEPTHGLGSGLDQTIRWFLARIEPDAVDHGQPPSHLR